MSFWGTGNVRVEVLDTDELTVLNTYSFKATNDRNSDRYTIEHDNKVNPVTRQFIQRIYGVRAVFRLFFIFDYWEKTNPDHNFQDVINVGNSRNTLRVTPHIDRPDVYYNCKVSDLTVGYNDTTTMINEIEIELTAIDLIPKVPVANPYVAESPDLMAVVET